jgi:hypothetical protein
MSRCRRFTSKDASRVARVLRVRVSPRLLAEGMNVEREHRDIGACRHPVLAGRIAMAHLRERLDYYKLLKRYVER